MNYFRTAILLAGLTGLFMAVGYLIGGQSGMLIAFVIAAATNLFSYWNADKLVLSMHGAQEVDARTAPDLVRLVGELAGRAGLPMPRVYLMDNPQPNAFATGRNPEHAAVAVTTGLWRRLDPQEVEAVLAHELSHIANRDVLVMTIASFFAMLAALLTRFGLYAGMFGGFGGGNRDSNNNQVPVWLIVFLVSVIVYAISFILIRTISRYREYAADRGSAIITGAPENLMSALQKISSNITQIPQRDLREVQGMNAFFIIPTNWKTQMSEWMMDHPPLEKRIAALSEIAREMGRPVS